MIDLGGRRVALLEARLPEELTALVRRYGGEPHCVPAVREERVPSLDAVAGLLDGCASERHPVLLLSTGAGVAALFADARALGREGDLRDLLGRATTVCRGPKPVAALHREGFAASVRAAAPYTTRELVASLDGVELAGRLAAVVHYGERNAALVEEVARRGARVRELVVYAWRMPEDVEPLRRLVGDIGEGRWGAVVFTSQVQARHLFEVARAMGREAELRQALATRTVVAAVGPTCAAALERLGVRPHVVPQNPKMGAMVAALAAHLSTAAPREQT